MKVVVTGAAGFVGTNLVLELIGAGHDVLGLDSLARRGTGRNLAEVRKRHADYRFSQLDVEDMPAAIRGAAPDVVYHLAAQVAVTTSLRDPLDDFRVNARGTLLVAQAAGEVGARVVYTSTNKVYGDNVNALPIAELETRYDFDGPMRARGVDETLSIDTARHTPYGVSKLVGEMYVRELGGVANRCSCMYGPHQQGVVDQGWLSHLARSCILGEQVEIFGDGKQLRDALHVRDVVRLLVAQGEALLDRASGLEGEVFNVGGGHSNTISLLELCARWSIDPRFAPWRMGDQKVFYADVAKARRVLGWQPKVGLDEGLADLHAWTLAALAADA